MGEDINTSQKKDLYVANKMRRCSTLLFIRECIYEVIEQTKQIYSGKK